MDLRASRTDVCAYTSPQASERGGRDPQYLASPSSKRAPTPQPNPGRVALSRKKVATQSSSEEFAVSNSNSAGPPNAATCTCERGSGNHLQGLGFRVSGRGAHLVVEVCDRRTPFARGDHYCLVQCVAPHIVLNHHVLGRCEVAMDPSCDAFD